MERSAPNIERPAFLDHDPVQLKFGTSGLRGLVREMTDLEVYINTQGFLRYVVEQGEAPPRTTVVVGRDHRNHDPASGQSSSPRIVAAVSQALWDLGFEVMDAGILPTPAIAAFAGDPSRKWPAVMVTGSHIPADRNGIKFYRPTSEVLKADEPGILEAVAAVRSKVYGQSADDSAFDRRGMLKASPASPPIDPAATAYYAARYLEPFGDAEPLAGVRIVVYQHSSASRDLLADILGTLGADVITTGRVDHFVAVDTEDVTTGDESKYRQMVLRYAADALVSTDGDGDRPLVVDDRGRFHRGDSLGILCAEYLGARYAAVPVSCTDAIEQHLGIKVVRTRIGSPYVIDAMNDATAAGNDGVVGWEANGGFLTATPFTLNGMSVRPLATRDAVLPIIAVLLRCSESGLKVSELFARLPPRATRAGLLDDFPPERGRAILKHLRPSDPKIAGIRFGATPQLSREDGQWRDAGDEALKLADHLATIADRYLGAPLAMGKLNELNLVDGVRMRFDTGEIIHLRPSGNAPQFRVYAVADAQRRADDLVKRIAAEPGGLLRVMERELLG